MKWPPEYVVAGLGLAGCAVGLLLAPQDLLRAWLVAAQAFLGLPLGALWLLAFARLVGGRWAQAMTPALLLIASSLPLALIAFLPLLGSIQTLLPFLTEDASALPERVANKLSYLHPLWVIVRTVLVMIAWGLAGFLLDIKSHASSRAVHASSAVVAMVLLAAGTLIFTTDWMQALEPEFTSTIYPMLVASTQVLGAFALAILLLWRDGKLSSPGGDAHTDLAGDLGKIAIAGILTYVYLAYMQWLIIWIGDLPSEIEWYLRRTAPPWGSVFALSALAFAAAPFLALIVRTIRSNPRSMALVAAIIVLGYLLESLWRLAPAFGAGLPFLALLAVTHATLGGAVAVYFARRPMQPGKEALDGR